MTVNKTHASAYVLLDKRPTHDEFKKAKLLAFIYDSWDIVGGKGFERILKLKQMKFEKYAVLQDRFGNPIISFILQTYPGEAQDTGPLWFAYSRFNIRYIHNVVRKLPKLDFVRNLSRVTGATPLNEFIITELTGDSTTYISRYEEELSRCAPGKLKNDLYIVKRSS
jgi:hypothetical protein